VSWWSDKCAYLRLMFLTNSNSRTLVFVVKSSNHSYSPVDLSSSISRSAFNAALRDPRGGVWRTKRGFQPVWNMAAAQRPDAEGELPWSRRLVAM